MVSTKASVVILAWLVALGMVSASGAMASGPRPVLEPKRPASAVKRSKSDKKPADRQTAMHKGKRTQAKPRVKADRPMKPSKTPAGVEETLVMVLRHTAADRVAHHIERLFRGDKVMEKPYYKKVAPVIDWQWMLVLGVVIGAFLSSQLSGRFQLQWVPEKWAETFGTLPLPRLIVALAGGILMGVGSRWAGGCTSGHGISGTLQLAISSWLATICFFVGGIATAMLIFRVLA